MNAKMKYMVLLLVGMLDGRIAAAPLPTTFTYQGVLSSVSSSANGTYDFEFSLYDALLDGGQLATTVTNTLGLTNGLFTVALDFGPVFFGQPCWLEIGVRSNGSGSAFTTLSPRQPIRA